MHHGMFLACGENTHTLRLTSKLVDLRVGSDSGFDEQSSPSRIS